MLFSTIMLVLILSKHAQHRPPFIFLFSENTKDFKGHLISKANYGLPTSSKKRTDEFDLFAFTTLHGKQIKSNPFVFWKKLADHKLLSRLSDL